MKIPSIKTSHVIGKAILLRLFAKNYPDRILDLIRQLSSSERLENYPATLIERIVDGWNLSHQLVDSPKPTRPLISLNLCLSNYITYDQIKNGELILKAFSKNMRFNIEEHLTHDIELEYYCYRLREGFWIKEDIGTGYYVHAPFMSSHYCDLRTCSCNEFLVDGTCEHMKLAQIHHKYRSTINAAAEQKQSEQLSKAK